MISITNILFEIYLIKLSIDDVRHQCVRISTLIGVGVLLFCRLVIKLVSCESTLFYVLLLIIPGLFLILISLISHQIGLADGIIVVQMGLVWMNFMVYITVAISIIFSGIYSLILLCSGRCSKKTGLPFIPFLASANLLLLILTTFI